MRAAVTRPAAPIGWLIAPSSPRTTSLNRLYRTTGAKVSGLQHEVDRHRHNYWDRNAAQQRRREPPLPDGVERGLIEERLRSEHSRRLHVPACIDRCLDDHDPLNVRCAGGGWINRRGI